MKHWPGFFVNSLTRKDGHFFLYINIENYLGRKWQDVT